MNKIKYGMRETYLYDMSDEQMEMITKKTNRGKGQTLFLFQLVDGNFDRLDRLENIIRETGYGCCPGTVSEVNKILG